MSFQLSNTNLESTGIGASVRMPWQKTRAVAARRIPWFEPQEVRALDEAAVDGRGSSLERMLEHAGRATADLAENVCPKPVGRIHVLCGGGGNGAGGLTAARHLLQRGREVVVYLPATFERESTEWRDAINGLPMFGGRVGVHPRPGPGDVVVDAMLGYSQRGRPRPPFDRWIRAANQSTAVRVALDVPTGIDPSTGQPQDPVFRSAHTLMLGVGKRGLRLPKGRAHAGHLWLADIGFPSRLDPRLKPLVSVFREAGGRPVRIR